MTQEEGEVGKRIHLSKNSINNQKRKCLQESNTGASGEYSFSFIFSFFNFHFNFLRMAFFNFIIFWPSYIACNLSLEQGLNSGSLH